MFMYFTFTRVYKSLVKKTGHLLFVYGGQAGQGKSKKNYLSEGAWG